MDPVSQLRTPRAAGTSPGPRDAGDFWGDFTGRARGVARAPYASSAPVRVARIAAVAAVLLVLVGGVRFLRPAASPATACAVIQSLNVATPHDSVFIMNDESSGGTIIWIGGIPPGVLNGG